MGGSSPENAPKGEESQRYRVCFGQLFSAAALNDDWTRCTLTTLQHLRLILLYSGKDKTTRPLFPCRHLYLFATTETTLQAFHSAGCSFHRTLFSLGLVLCVNSGEKQFDDIH